MLKTVVRNSITIRFVIFIACLLFMCLSCEDDVYTTEVKKCISQKSDRYVIEHTSDHEDYFQMIAAFERRLLEKGVLADRTSKSFIRLFEERLSDRNQRIKAVYSENSEMLESYSIVSGLVMMNVLFTCPYEALDTNNAVLFNLFKARAELLDRASATSYEDHEVIIEYLNLYNEKDFENIVARAPIINIVLYKLRDKGGLKK